MAKEFVTVTLNEQPHTFRALDLDQLEQLEPQFAIVTAAAQQGGALPKEAIRATAEIAAASLQAKHPGLSVAQVRKLITVATVSVVMEAVRGVSQIEPAKEGGSGEASAGNP